MLSWHNHIDVGVRFCCLLLYAVLLLQHVLACTMRVAYVYNACGTWDRPTNKVRTVDRVRINGCKWFKWLVKQLQEDFTDCKDALQSGGYFFVHCLRNNLSVGITLQSSPIWSTSVDRIGYTARLRYCY